MSTFKTVESHGRIPGTSKTPYYIAARHAWLVRGGEHIPHFNRGIALKGGDTFIQKHQEMVWIMDEWRRAGGVEWYEHIYHLDGLVSTKRITDEQAEDFLRDIGIDAYDRDVLFGRREPAY